MDSVSQSEPPLVRVLGSHLVDQSGRVWLGRGVSVSGDSKLPARPELPTHSTNLEAFYDHRNVSFVGRPFPLDTADEHLGRLATIGMKLIRFVVVWEAIEHSGPGQYDEEFIDYLVKVMELLPKQGLVGVVDVHMDTWSRLSGGSGAPGWTLELAGFDIRKLHDSGAASIHNVEPHDGGIWPSNYQKLAAATMYTLFFSGDRHAPERKIRRSEHAQWKTVFGGEESEYVGIGTFLQSSLIAAYTHLFERLAGNKNVIGIEPMNEPHRGYIELASFHQFDDKTDLHIGHVPSPVQSLALGSGHPQTVPFYVQSWPRPYKIARHDLITPPTDGAWSAQSAGCVWKQHNVWEWSKDKKQAVVLRSSYFQTDPVSGESIDFYADCLRPYVCRFAQAAHRIRPDWLVFAGSVPNEFTPHWPKETQPPNLVAAEHFYDLYTLFYRTFGNVTFNVQKLSRGGNALWNLFIGASAAQRNYRSQIENIYQAARDSTSAPSYVTETGMPWNINAKRRKRDTKWQEKAFNALATAYEELSLPFAWWCYTPSNTRAHGDGWNGEDFSFFSLDAPTTSDPVYSHTRGMDAIERAYVVSCAGVPGIFYSNIYNLDLSFRFHNPLESMPLHGALKSRTTEIYLPRRRFADKKLTIGVSDGTHTYDRETQTLKWTVDITEPSREHTIYAGAQADGDKQPGLYEVPPDVDSSEWPWLLILAAFFGLLALILTLAFWPEDEIPRVYDELSSYASEL